MEEASAQPGIGEQMAHVVDTGVVDAGVVEYRGPGGDIEIPEVSLYELLFESLDEATLERVALDDEASGLVLTFRELRHDVDAIAAWLHARGIGLDGRVAICLHNRPEYAAAFHGILRAGAAVTPVSPSATAMEIDRQLRMTAASIVITSPAELERVADAVRRGSGVRTVVVINPAPAPTPELPEGADLVDYADLLSTPPNPPQVSFDPATHIACLPVSSGTSGIPKAVMLTHRNLVANMLQFSDVLDPVGDDLSVVCFLPFNHIYALTTNMNFALLRGFPQYTMPAFSPELFARIMSTRHPSLLFIVPPVATFLVRSPAMASLPWGDVRLVVSGAAPLDLEAGEALQETFGVRVIQGYGMTELSPVSHVIPVDRTDIPLDSIGLAVRGVRFRVVDPATGLDVAPAAPGQWSAPGELWVKGPNTMLGYLDQAEHDALAADDPELDAAASAAGYVRTGDLVQVDAEGVVRVVDRMKELIKRRGFQVAPAELEALLVTHPQVLDAAVLGRSKHDGEQIPHALLVLTPGADEATPSAVLHWANEQMAAYKRIGGASVVPAIPRSAAGKILRRELPALIS